MLLGVGYFVWNLIFIHALASNVDEKVAYADDGREVVYDFCKKNCLIILLTELLIIDYFVI